MFRNFTSRILACVALAGFLSPAHAAPYQMENLNRGVVAVRTGSGVYVGWRLLGLDPASIGFNVYRGATRVNGAVITTSTNLVDTGANLAAANTYTVRAVVNGVEQAAGDPGFTLPANASTDQYLRVALQRPNGGTTPAGEAYTYAPNDCLPADLDGDGEYEIVVKWEPTNTKDNSQSGYTGNTYLDGYRLNGTRLWRIDLGRNIRSGAHYTQFLAYDLDGDGRAEVCAKTADATISGTGQVIGNGGADHRNSAGYILAGPEFFTVFNGLTGAILATANYNPPRGTVSAWGDSYGNRVDRFNATIAYVDGSRPSAIMCRGYYTRAVLAAWDWRNGQLTQRWVFDTGHTGGSLGAYRGQGPHSVSVADVDSDGRQEIVYGACTIEDNGGGKYSTGEGHGDAQHVGDFIPSRPGLEYWMAYEKNSGRAAGLVDANTGAIIMSKANTSGTEGPGRGVADDIYAGNPGAEFWGAGPGMTNLFNASGGVVGRTPSSANYLIYWDADLIRELLNGVAIDKYGLSSDTRLLTGSGVASNNGTKSTPATTADFFGDWREEVVWRETGNTAIRIYTTTNVTTNRIHTLMHDPQYRVQVTAAQSSYNQPPHTSFLPSVSVPSTPRSDITYVGGTTPNNNPPSVSITSPVNGATFTAGANITINATASDTDGTVTGVQFFQGATSLGTDTSSAYSVTWNNVPAGTYVLTARATDDDGAQTTSSPVSITVGGGGGADTYQAESAVLAGGTISESTNAGFLGSGYANSSLNGGTITFNNVDGNGGGTKSLSIRFALGATAARTGNLVVNGTTTSITFQPTGAWTTWQTQNVNIALNNNTSNTITFTTTGGDLANIDQITVP